MDNIDKSKGYAAFVAFQQPAWHGLGTILTEAVTTLQALQHGGLDYNVIKLPNIHLLPNGQEIISKSSFFTLRTDNNKILGDKLGSGYTVLQNLEALNVVDEILQSGRATIETAGVLDEGRRAFILLKADKTIMVGDRDVIKQYVLICTSHDGTLAITALQTNVRVVCANTLAAALRGAAGAIKIRHTANAAARLYEAAKVLNMISTNTEVNTENYNRMAETIISRADMLNYFGNIYLDESEIKKVQAGTKLEDAVSTQKLNTMTGVLDYANSGQGQGMALAGSGNNLNMWYAYNAVTGYTTAKKYANVNDRAKSLLFGTGAQTIQDAGMLALNPTKIIPLSKQGFGNINLN